jgi:hypothetical protein
MTFALAKAWPRKIDDPLASKQSWTCPVHDCWTKFVTKFGMIAQLTVRGETYWFRTPVKDWDTLDLQAWGHEQTAKQEALTTPEALYNSLKGVRPLRFDELFLPAVPSVLRSDVDQTMVFTIRGKEALERMPLMGWANIFAVFQADRYHGKKKLL